MKREPLTFDALLALARHEQLRPTSDELLALTYDELLALTSDELRALTSDERREYADILSLKGRMSRQRTVFQPPEEPAPATRVYQPRVSMPPVPSEPEER